MFIKLLLSLACMGYGSVLPQQASKIIQKPDYKTYVSREYSFTLQYPPNYGLKAYGSESFVFIEKNEFWVDFDVFNIEKLVALLADFRKEKSMTEDRFREVIIDRAIAYSGADGPDGSYQCSDPEIVDDFINRNGLRTLKFYLTGTLSNYTDGTEISKRTGPFYGVKISVNDKPHAILIRYKRQALASADHEKMLKKIVESISSIKLE